MPVSRSRASRPRTERDASRGVGVARARGKLTNNKAQAAAVSEEKPLTDQQRLFVKFWAQGESPLSASIKAGYADNGTYAYRMIYMPNILKLYHEEKAAFERDSGMTRQKVIAGFLEGIEMAKVLGEPSTVVGGWREIGRMCGYYEPVQVKHTVTHEGKLMIDKLDKLSDQELMQLMEERMKAMLAPQPVLENADGDDAP